MSQSTSLPDRLQDGNTVAIVGGGPAGSFSAIHLLRRARAKNLGLRIVVFERRRLDAGDEQADRRGFYEGCPQCAGGISPRLNDALDHLGIIVPPEVLQAQISSITVQGNWKHIHLPVPPDRKMLSVYRGALPFGQHIVHESFDSLVLGVATGLGAELIGSRVDGAYYADDGRPVLCYQIAGKNAELAADFVVFAGGVNEKADKKTAGWSSEDLFRMLQPDYEPPGLRKALIFELEAPRDSVEVAQGNMHFIESSVDQLRLDMCSIIPKRDYFTVTLIGGSVDESSSHKENLQLIRDFLALPQIRRTLPPETELRIRCICNPSIVVGSANRPFGRCTAAVGDMATSRQYKDGILSAHDMAKDLADVIFEQGTDLASLESGYGATLARFRRDNRYATLIFLLYRWFFTSPSLSRVIYQTYASELKVQQESRRSFEKIFWAISSGDQSYERIAWSMLRPATLWKILSGGIYVTLRNWLGEFFFGLDWSGIGRFPTAVSLEQLQLKRGELLGGRHSEFECIYTIRLRADPLTVFGLLGDLGEPERAYLTPRWVSIRRISGLPLQSGCVIQYRIFGGLISFTIEQQSTEDDKLLSYRVCDGFANGGSFLFEVEPDSPKGSSLTVYLAFDYARGNTFSSRVFWWFFRALFPEYIHDVIWNHALCEIKQLAEAIDMEREPEMIDLVQL